MCDVSWPCNMRDANKAKTQPGRRRIQQRHHLLGSTVSLAGDLNVDRDPLVGADCSWRYSSRVRKGGQNSESSSAIPLRQPRRPASQVTSMKDPSMFICGCLLAYKIEWLIGWWWILTQTSTKWVIKNIKTCRLFWTIAPMIPGGFLHFLYQWEQEWMLYRAVAKFITIP